MTEGSVPEVSWLTARNIAKRARNALLEENGDEKIGVGREFSLFSSRKTSERSATFRRSRESQRGKESVRSRVRLDRTRGGIESRFEYLNVETRFPPAKAKESEILTRIG